MEDAVKNEKSMEKFYSEENSSKDVEYVAEKPIKMSDMRKLKSQMKIESIAMEDVRRTLDTMWKSLEVAVEKEFDHKSRKKRENEIKTGVKLKRTYEEFKKF
ncbi:hypothetical protein QVD17_38597 [Tagetes erecta]|uniref:Uncharacterized protein n=1 Tax=Tagetes erecta TaxID=13708 RepID=A0AAD8JM33_TARER|nr:hypothetical protein QVD17_38597 [Tagetes erecta]